MLSGCALRDFKSAVAIESGQEVQQGPNGLGCVFFQIMAAGASLKSDSN